MTVPTFMKSLANVAGLYMRLLALGMRLALVERSGALYAAAARSALVLSSPAGAGVTPMPDQCQSCKDTRRKKGLPSMDRIRLPAAVTDARNFRKPKLPTYVCPYCDGETLINTALRSYQARQGS